jgi:2-iminobutanoate/2-iminopropanoate deaminase
MKEIVLTNHAPAPIGPYSQAVKAGQFVYLSGQIPLDPQSGALVKGIAAETRQVFENLKAVLEGAGSSLDKVLKTTVYMTNLGEFAEMNKVYEGYFPARPPARSTVQVASLPRGVSVEIDVIAET